MVGKDSELHSGKESKGEFHLEKLELSRLLQSLPGNAPDPGTGEYVAYLAIEKQIGALKEKISKKHKDWMEWVDAEEKISQDLNRNKS